MSAESQALLVLRMCIWATVQRIGFFLQDMGGRMAGWCAVRCPGASNGRRIHF
jgi:hypothetical protein